MNRLSPLIVRHRPLFAAHAVTFNEWYEDQRDFPEWAERLIEDAKLFGIAWLGGFIFFGTLLS